MQAIVLHECRVEGDLLEQERDQRQAVLFGDLRIKLGELAGVAWPIVRRNPDAYQEYARPCTLGQLHHFHQIVFGSCNRQPP